MIVIVVLQSEEKSLIVFDPKKHGSLCFFKFYSSVNASSSTDACETVQTYEKLVS